jgi:hypothetical protein
MVSRYYRDKKVVGVFVRFRGLQLINSQVFRRSLDSKPLLHDSDVYARHCVNAS